MHAVAEDTIPDSPEALYQFGKSYLKHHLVKYRNGVAEHPLTRALEDLLDPHVFTNGYEQITKHLTRLVRRGGERGFAGCPKVIKDLLFCYARASERCFRVGEDVDAADHGLFAIALQSSSRYIQEGALLGLGQWAQAGDMDAIELLRKPTPTRNLERLRRLMLRGAVDRGDNSSPAACDEIDRLLDEKAKVPDDPDEEKMLREMLGDDDSDDPYKGWTHVEFPKVPSAQYIGLMRNVFGLHSILSLGFVECLRINDLFSMPANNFKNLTLTANDDDASPRLAVFGQTFWLTMENVDDREHWKIRGAVKSFPHPP